MKKKSNKKSQSIIGTIITILILLILGIIEGFAGANGNNVSNNSVEQSELTGDTIKVYYFDVGQADSILLTSNNEAMLIDAGNNDDGDLVVNNIKNLGITKLKYVVGTHPHEDHIGGMDEVIKNFDIENVYMPKIQTNTKTFEDVLDAIADKGLKITAPQQGSTFKVGDIDCEVMLCGSGTEQEQKSNLNLSSIVIKATYGEKSFLFTGDEENENEESRSWEKINVLKVGHHGSNTSTSQDFLNQIKPDIAIISVGKNNKYGHPTKKTLDKLNNIGARIYRTDESGTITVTSDGKNILVQTEK